MEKLIKAKDKAKQKAFANKHGAEQDLNKLVSITQLAKGAWEKAIADKVKAAAIATAKKKSDAAEAKEAAGTKLVKQRTNEYNAAVAGATAFDAAVESGGGDAWAAFNAASAAFMTALAAAAANAGAIGDDAAAAAAAVAANAAANAAAVEAGAAAARRVEGASGDASDGGVEAAEEEEEAAGEEEGDAGAD